ILITAAVVLLAGLTLFIRCRTRQSADASEVTRFLYKFNDNVKAGNADSLLAFFQADKKTKTLKGLVNLLAGKKGKNGKKPLAHIALDIDNSEIKNINGEIITASIPVNFSHDSLDNEHSILLLKIYQTAPHQYKIIQADARKFYTDYVAYSNYIRSKTIPDEDIFSPITLAAFKATDQLKVRYDSCIWFDHIDNKTFFYVIIGKLNFNFYDREDLRESEKQTYYMGLVNPDLKEIIPPKYDLIHNISGTIDGLVEVEKDGKKGFYNLDGKIIVPVNYNQVIPLNDDENLALLRNDEDYFYLKKDTTITEKISDFKISEILPKFKTFGDSYTLSEKSSKNVMEYNSRKDFTSLIVPPSYLVELQILPKFINFHNPLRHEDETLDESQKLDVKYNGISNENQSWFESVYYSIIDHFLDGRSGLYESNEARKVLIVDQKKNRIFSYEANNFITDDQNNSGEAAKCNENYFRAINDTLFEFRTTALPGVPLFDTNKFFKQVPSYSYLYIKNGKLTSLPNDRIFGCTKYVKMDDSYLNSCFVLEDKPLNYMTKEILEYMKNEIYASYGYKFKNNRWNEVFMGSFDNFQGPKHSNVDDSLTSIDKFNINWINQKLKTVKTNTNTLAAK
ncbi:MAG TPA: WG repeat-containing protein, partial [Mucilaginibacter sp.]